jgi:hypothetical protein
MPNIRETRNRLKTGTFKAVYINNPKGQNYSMDYGSFQPPSTILLDKNLPSSDHPLHIPDFAETLTKYSAVHELIHADDHTGGDKLLLETRKHVLKTHEDKLEKSLHIIESDGGSEYITNFDDLASLWAIQYVDMVTHYRSYVVLRHMQYPKLDQIWSRLSTDYFPPNLLTCIEVTKGISFVFNLFTDEIGNYCLIEALEDYSCIKKRETKSYMV